MILNNAWILISLYIILNNPCQDINLKNIEGMWLKLHTAIDTSEWMCTVQKPY